jgi:microcystin-dependent protein
MADWSLPALTSVYTNTLTEIKNRDIDLALQFDGTTSTSIPTGTIRWTSSANTWQRWTGSAWGALSSVFAFPAITTTGAASIGTTLGVTGVATLSGGGTSTTPATDNNTTNIATTAFVVGQAAATAPVMDGTAAVGTSFRYARQDHVHPTDTTRAPLASPTFTGTVTIPAGASISGYAPLASPTFTGTVTIPSGASISGYAALASPTFTGTPAAPTATAGTNTTQLATTAFVSSAVGSITTTPAGAIDFFAMSSAPAGYIKANGAAVSRTTYSALFTAISTTFGAGDGTTTFNVPDLRGQFLRSWADGSTTYDSGRTLGSTQADDFKSHAHNFTVYSGTGQTGPFFQGNTVYGPRTTDATGGTETRPRNIALLACIKF